MDRKIEIISTLKELIAEGGNITVSASYMSVSTISKGQFNGWRNKILIYLGTLNNIPEEVINSIKSQRAQHPQDIEAVKSQLNTLIQSIEQGFIDCINPSESRIDSDTILENLFNRFHKVARQLRTRHDRRATLDISDEYDVQDLLHALLLINFDDVRPEEWTPSYAGGASRMDFLLKNERTVIEVKKTRSSMTSKDLGEQLIVDIEKYQMHPDCEKLYCFVYDPEGLLGNPIGIKNDLENAHKDFLKVFIKPE